MSSDVFVRQLQNMRGDKCMIGDKMSVEALVLLLALTSSNRCEFSVDHYLLTNELEANGILTTANAGGTKHSARVASDRRGVALTELGQIMADEIIALLEKSGLIKTMED